MKRRIIQLAAAALLTLLLAGVMTGKAEAVVVVDSGTCGGNLNWILDEEGLLTIYGYGPMEDYVRHKDFRYDSHGVRQEIIYYTYPWMDVSDQIKTIVVGEGVTTIGNMAFAEIGTVKEVYLPVSLSRVVYGAFYETGLTDVYYAGTQNQWSGVVKEQYNTPLTVASRHDKSPYSGDNPYLPPPQPAAGEWGESVNWSLEDGVLTISGVGAMPFGTDYGQAPWNEQKETIKKVVVEDTVTSVGAYAFWDCGNLTEVSLGKGVTYIGKAAFVYCKRLSAITLPEGVETIADWVFAQNSALTSIVLPSSLTYIGETAFFGCENLTDVYYSGTEEQWNAIRMFSRDDPEDFLCQAEIHYDYHAEPETAISVPAVSGNTVTVDISCAEPAAAFCAVYDDSGKMLEALTKPVEGKKEEQKLAFQFNNGDFSAAKVFLLDSNSVPLCESKGA